MAAIPPVNTVLRSLMDCGVENHSNGVIWNGESASQRIASKVFNNNFSTCIDITLQDLDDRWKTYSSLTVNEGCIRIKPTTKFRIRAFTEWVRHKIRSNQLPSDEPFPVADCDDLIDQYNTHKQWVSEASNMAKSARLKNFTEKMKWMDWKLMLINFLRTQPGRNGVPLNYVIWDSKNPVIRNNVNFLDDYVDRALLAGRPYQTDTSKVHSFIIRFISENNVAEQKILLYKDLNDGRRDFMALKEFYKEV